MKAFTVFAFLILAALSVSTLAADTYIIPAEGSMLATDSSNHFVITQCGSLEVLPYRKKMLPISISEDRDSSVEVKSDGYRANFFNAKLYLASLTFCVVLGAGSLIAGRRSPR